MKLQSSSYQVRVPWYFTHRMMWSLCIPPKVTSNRLRSPIGETASAHGFDTGFMPMSIVFPNSVISPGGLHSRADLGRSPGTRAGGNRSFLWFESRRCVVSGMMNASRFLLSHPFRIRSVHNKYSAKRTWISALISSCSTQSFLPT